MVERVITLSESSIESRIYFVFIFFRNFNLLTGRLVRGIFWSFLRMLYGNDIFLYLLQVLKSNSWECNILGSQTFSKILGIMLTNFPIFIPIGKGGNFRFFCDWNIFDMVKRLFYPLPYHSFVKLSIYRQAIIQGVSTLALRTVGIYHSLAFKWIKHRIVKPILNSILYKKKGTGSYLLNH